jgi:integrase
MPKVRLTKQRIEAMATPETEQVVWDASLVGFGVRLLPSGLRTFILQRRTKSGRSIRLKIARVGDLSADQARDRARELIAEIVLGRDPASERREARLAERARRMAPTVQHLAEEWLAHGQTRAGLAWREPTAEAYRRAVARHILPELGRLRVEAVERKHIRAMLASVKHPIARNRTLAAVRAMFSHAVRSDDWQLSINPAAGIGAAPENKRHRYPQNGELQRLVEALQGRDDRASKFIMMLLLTGARRGELLASRWADFDLDAGTWVKPEGTTKTRRTHRIPLNQQAVELLREIKAVEPFWPFGRLRLAQIRVAWEEVKREARIEDLRVHDLRHFHASLLASMGLSLPVIGALLGHASQSTTQRYAHLVDEALREASEKVGALVIPLPRREGGGGGGR